MSREDATSPLQDVIDWFQAAVTALAVGDIKQGSMLHHKMRDVAITYRDSIREDDEK